MDGETWEARALLDVRDCATHLNTPEGRSAPRHTGGGSGMRLTPHGGQMPVYQGQQFIDGQTGFDPNKLFAHL